MIAHTWQNILTRFSYKILQWKFLQIYIMHLFKRLYIIYSQYRKKCMRAICIRGLNNYMLYFCCLFYEFCFFMANRYYAKYSKFGQFKYVKIWCILWCLYMHLRAWLNIHANHRNVFSQPAINWRQSLSIDNQHSSGRPWISDTSIVN